MIFRPLVVLTLMLLVFDLRAAGYATPSERVRALSDSFITVMQNNPQDRNARWVRLANIIYDSFDFRSRSQSVVYSRWRQAGEDERRKYTEFFAQYLDAVYSPGLQNIILRDEAIRDELATVETVVHADGKVVAVYFELKNNGGDWFAYDVVVDGNSLTEVFHSIHAAINRKEGLEAMSSEIRRRIDRYRESLPAEAKADAQS